MTIKVTIFNEFIHEKEEGKAKETYPNGLHEVIKEFLSVDENLEVRIATQDMPDHGLTDEVLENTDVLFWWGHVGHYKISEEVADKVAHHVRLGMGLIVLHSGHDSKPFKKLMGTACTLSWRDIGERERMWVIDPTHPIVQGVDTYFELEQEEMYSEPFEIPIPDESILVGWYEGGEIFRSGCVFKRGYGKIFYFQPGHEEYPTYYNKSVQKILTNAVYYLKPMVRKPDLKRTTFLSPAVDPKEPGILEKYNVAEKPSEFYARLKKKYLK